MWKEYDYDGNGLVSLGEIDRVVTRVYPEYNKSHYKPALVRAYKMADADGSGLISRDEFGTLLRALAYFQDLWERFEKVGCVASNIFDHAESNTLPPLQTGAMPRTCLDCESAFKLVLSCM